MSKMSTKKDVTLLEGVSDHFTEKTLRNILCTKYNGKDAEVISWEFDEAGKKGDSYLSTVNKIKVNGVVDGKEVQVNLVVKSVPKNVGRRKTFRSTEFFGNEILFYTKVIPKFQEFLKDKEQSQLLCIPTHLSSAIGDGNDYIALEDVSVLGYGRVSRQDCISLNECALLLKSMAKFHAISFAFKDQKKEEFTEIMQTLKETYFSKDHWNWYKRFHEKLVGIAKDALNKEYPGSAAEKQFCSFKIGELFDRCCKFCERQCEPTSIITQGDCWAPNFLARNVNGKEDALMLDFQLARCASLICDLSFCIYSCTDKTLWDESFDDLLKIYYNELSSSIALLGSKPEELYPWDTFMKEVQEQSVFGMVFSLEAVPFSLLDESQAFDLDEIIKDDNEVNIADVWTLSNIKTKAGRLRLANVIAHAVEKGFL